MYNGHEVLKPINSKWARALPSVLEASKATLTQQILDAYGSNTKSTCPVYMSFRVSSRTHRQVTIPE